MKLRPETTVLNVVEDKVYPTYAVQVLNSRRIVVGGGGNVSGGAYCGLMFIEISHDGQTFTKKLIGRVPTPIPVDALSVHVSSDKTVLACGRDDKCVLYEASLHFSDEHHEEQTTNNNKSEAKNILERSEQLLDSLPLTYTLKEVGCAQGAKSEKGEVTCLRISSDSSLIATGSTDGYLRVFALPGMENVREVHAHTKDVYDLDISSDGQKIVTVGADSCGYVWQTKDGKKLSQLELPTTDKYRFRRCRFSQRGSDSRPHLYTIANPPMKSKFPSLLQRWNTGTFLAEEVAYFKDALSSVCVSSDSRYVAVATMTGHLMIHDALTLQRIHLFKDVHGTAITAIDFLPTTLPFVSGSGEIETAVISVALDGYTKIHSLTYADDSNLTAGILIILIALLLTYLLCETSILGIGIVSDEPEL